MGLPRGREEIQAFFVGLQDSIHGFWHFTTNETISVDGDRAHGEAYLYLTCVMAGTAYVGAGRYDDEFQRHEGQWLIHRRVVTSFYFVPNTDGWLAGKIVPESARKAVDRSVTLI
jgi:ketosteroid isomerase-like protein